MSSAPREENRIPALIAKSDASNDPVIIEADPITKRLKVTGTISGDVTLSPGLASTAAYGINDKESGATYNYYGFERADGAWYIMRKELSTNAFRYASGASAYSTAWTNRATQTYASYGATF